MDRSLSTLERAASVIRREGTQVAATVFLILAAAVSADAQCDYHLQFSGQYRASIFDVFIDNNDLWTATGYGIQLFDRSTDPPQLVSSVAIPGLTRIVRASNGVAYAAGTSGISVVQRVGKSLQF